MDVSQVASLPVSIPNRSSVGEMQNYVQAPALDSLSLSPSSTSLIADTTSKSDASKTADTPIDTRETPTADHLMQAVKHVNDSFSQRGQSLYASFEKDKITGINVVKIVDKKTHETISQMPPREIVRFAQALELPQGIRGQLLHDMA